jgi:alkyl sulfatase BDS1-like metallo-beta-lactamase superfamily hydrolase
VPEKFAEKPYLQPIYDEPEFIVRNIWRLEGGWHDGTASHLKPASEAEQAREIAELAGGVGNLIARAIEKLEAGKVQLACHLIDWAAAAEPDNKSAHETRVRIYDARARDSASTMSHGIFRAAVVESAQKAGIPPPPDPRSH